MTRVGRIITDQICEHRSYPRHPWSILRIDLRPYIL